MKQEKHLINKERKMTELINSKLTIYYIIYVSASWNIMHQSRLNRSSWALWIVARPTKVEVRAPLVVVGALDIVTISVLSQG